MTEPSTVRGRDNRPTLTAIHEHHPGQVLICPTVLQPSILVQEGARPSGQVTSTYNFPDEGLQGSKMRLWHSDPLDRLMLLRYEESGRVSSRMPLMDKVQFWLTEECYRNWQHFMRGHSLGPNSVLAMQFVRSAVELVVFPPLNGAAGHTRVRCWKFWGIRAMYTYDPNNEHQLAAEMALRWREHLEVPSDDVPGTPELLPAPMVLSEG